MKFKSRLDKVVWSVVVVLAIFIAGMLLGGDYTVPAVQYFNAAHDFVSPQSGQFLFRFNRLMDRKSVEEGFRISPEVEGRFSWSGRTFAFTAKEPLAYGQHYTLVFQDARDLAGKVLVDNVFQVATRPQTALFLNEAGEVMQVEIVNKQTARVSPEHLFVQQFKVSPLGDTLALLATERGKTNLGDRTQFQLYLYDLKNKNLHRVQTPLGNLLDNLQWLPDGSGIGFSLVNMNANQEGIYIFDRSTQVITPIAADKARAYQFYFTPDASSVAYIDVNGAVILGDIPDGNGALVVTTFIDLAGFDTMGDYLAYIAPTTVNAFDLTNVPVLMNADGEEKKVPVPQGSTSFDVQFLPNQKKLLFTLERPFGTLRKDDIYTYDYEQDILLPVVESDICNALYPVPSPDARLLVWQCVRNDNKGYALTGWNDYQGKMITADLWLKDLVTGEEFPLGVQGADVQFLP